MTLHQQLEIAVKKAVEKLFSVQLENVEITLTRKDQQGDLTVMVFPMLRHIKGNPAIIGEQIGAELQSTTNLITSYEVIKGFLNITVAHAAYLNDFNTILANQDYGREPVDADQPGVMVEYSSPNTNKPLHLGHIRNNLLGYAVAEIIKATGRPVNKTQIINDRGIHICKSMLAWEHENAHLPESEQDTPENRGVKGDKLVGNYYVSFESRLKTQTEPIFKNYREGIIDPPTISGQTIKSSNRVIFELEERKKIEINNLDYSKVAQLGNTFEIKLETAIDNGLLISNISRMILTESDISERNTISKLVIRFDKIVKSITDLEGKISDEIAKIYKIARDRTELMGQAQEMLRKWEQGDKEVVDLWSTMNAWVYDGFETTYKNLGVNFDSIYYESNTYLLGKDVVQDGLEKDVFYRKDDGSVWIDLTDEGLDEKIVLRSDGTAVYMTQDIGTAIQRVKDHHINSMVYTVGNEQDYHFKVLFLILKKLGYDWADNLYHLSYGMVELPSGKMKSREGTVVDADDLMEEMTTTARDIAQEQGKLEGLSDTEKERLYKVIGLGALKYFMLKVDPRKGMLFNPAESVDFQGNTGPFIQYTHARIKSILKKSGFDSSILKTATDLELTDKDIAVIKSLQQYPDSIKAAAANYSPALVANYVYELVKEFNSFYQNVPKIVEEDNQDLKQFRLLLCYKTAQVIKSACGLLGIEVPEQM